MPTALAINLRVHFPVAYFKAIKSILKESTLFFSLTYVAAEGLIYKLKLSGLYLKSVGFISFGNSIFVWPNSEELNDND